ncbi:MAG: sensor histidine kinase N-terminal domain-containing protein [Betaproteobacteria bacterium]|nr:sensor histidine kinase N-terminal domain-containing protein [Betaproteobacteria bacterium]
MRGGSLSRRLLLLSLAAVAVVWVASSIFAVVRVRHEAGELLDAHLVQAAAMLHARVGDDVDESELEHAPELHRYARGLAFQVWDEGRKLRLHSANAPDTRLSPQERGFSDVESGGRAWRVYSSLDRKGRVLVQVAEERRARDRIAGSVAGALLLPMIVGLPVLGLLIWLALRSGLKPLVALGRDVAVRDPDNLQPLEAADAPREVGPLVASLNGLFGRLRQSIDHERRFNADAAHELRTPLAGVRAQAEVALGASADAERTHALRQVIAGCDRAARLVDQMLTLARLDPKRTLAGGARFDLAAVARDAIAEIAPAGHARGVDVALDASPAQIVGDPALVAILLRNLLDNAIRHGPAGTTVEVGVQAVAGGAELVVTDQGPGVPPEERDRLGERFHRVLGTGETGSGLGLSIVRRIAELHHAEVAFGAAPSGRGFAARVRFARR